MNGNDDTTAMNSRPAKPPVKVGDIMEIVSTGELIGVESVIESIQRYYGIILDDNNANDLRSAASVVRGCYLRDVKRPSPEKLKTALTHSLILEADLAYTDFRSKVTSISTVFTTDIIRELPPALERTHKKQAERLARELSIPVDTAYAGLRVTARRIEMRSEPAL